MNSPAIDIKEHEWQIVADILKTHIPQYEVWAFGSRVTMTARPYSDLDLAFITAAPLSLETHAALNDAFIESDLPWKVDIVDWANVSDAFKTIIQKNKVVIQKS